jgi:ubiquinone/menaquinone biosynthesis C-methylase UbiE
VWLERPALAVAADLLDLSPGERLLDVGTGTGAFLRELAGRTPRFAQAVGVDSSARMLSRAGALPRGWRLVNGDARALPFPDASFDAASAAYLLHVLTDDELARVLDELHRVLVPGGRLVTVTPTTPRSAAARPYERIVRSLARMWPAAFAGLRPFDATAPLRRASFELTGGCYVSRGYPSLCLLSVATSPTSIPSRANAP